LAQNARRHLGSEQSQGFLLFDGYISRLTETVNAFASQNDITLVIVPQHSSHMLQPFDQVLFRRVKAQLG
jgi:hypothetical protein